MKQSKISIDEETHKMLKVYCAQRCLSMGQFVAKIIRERIGEDVSISMFTMQEDVRNNNQES